MAFCHFHPDRAGVGVCIRCRKVICAACRTRVDGVNHCHACLKALGSRNDEPGKQVAYWPLLSVGMLTVSFMVLAGICTLLQGCLAP